MWQFVQFAGFSLFPPPIPRHAICLTFHYLVNCDKNNSTLLCLKIPPQADLYAGAIFITKSTGFEGKTVLKTQT